jgi:hypothetical protein
MSSESTNHVIIDNECDNKKIPIAKKQINLPKYWPNIFLLDPLPPQARKKRIKKINKQN